MLVRGDKRTEICIDLIDKIKKYFPNLTKVTINTNQEDGENFTKNYHKFPNDTLTLKEFRDLKNKTKIRFNYKK